MGTRSIFWAALVACVPIAGLFAGDEPAKPGVAAEQLVGEWKQLVTLQKNDDTLMVITFRRNGVCTWPGTRRWIRRRIESSGDAESVVRR
jgi:hypothetical protein